MKYLPLFLLLSFIALEQKVKAQPVIGATPENYEKVLKYTSPTTDQFDTVWQVISQYYRKAKDSCIILSQHAEEITKNSPDQSLYGKALYLKATATFERDSTGYFILLDAKKILEKSKDTLTLSKVEMGLSSFCLNESDYESAIKYSLNAVSILKQAKDSSNLANALVGIGGIYFSWDKPKKAIGYLDQAIDILEKQGNRGSLAGLLSNKAKAVKILGDRYKSMSETTSTKSEIYQDSAQYFYRTGLSVAQKGLQYAKETNNQIGIVATLVSVSNLNIETGNLKEALRVSKEAVKIGKATNHPFFYSQAKIALSRAYRKLNQYHEALKHGEDVLEMSKTTKGLVVFEDELYKTYKAMGMDSKALSMLEIIRKNEKKKHEKESKEAVEGAETKYRTSEKEKEILLQQNEILELKVKNDKIQKQKNLIMGGGLLFTLLGFFGYRVNKLQKDRNDKIAFAEALIFAQEEERKRIAQDLHDGVGQSLLLLKKQMITTSEVTTENQKMISETLEEVRSISRDLHPLKLGQFGLTDTLEEMVSKIEKSTNLFISEEIENIDNVLPPKSEIHIYRTIQEALSNIVKHAKATAAKVSIKNLEDHVQVLIQDNGEGFDLELAVATSKSLGIKTMHERVSAINGQLKIERGTKNGTHISITIPKRK